MIKCKNINKECFCDYISISIYIKDEFWVRNTEMLWWNGVQRNEGDNKKWVLSLQDTCNDIL